MPLLPMMPTTGRPWRAIVSNSRPLNPKAPSPSSRQIWRPGRAFAAPIAWPGPAPRQPYGPGSIHAPGSYVWMKRPA